MNGFYFTEGYTLFFFQSTTFGYTPGKKDRINITDVDAHVMGQANEEKNPAHSNTTTTDMKRDIITHFQVNPQEDDGAALKGSIEGSRTNTARRHRIVIADARFASIENLAYLEADNQMALMPDGRMKFEVQRKTWREKYDRSRFRYCDKAD